MEDQEGKLKEQENKLRKVGEKYNVNFDAEANEKKHQEAMALKEQKH